ncbi:hypothetical protein [Nonomuraea glycinis]|uniref:hypothetical protein n=1 Tax=Nonomuraea glycinis TaxID=2047744 RepID=UPI0033A19EF4
MNPGSEYQPPHRQVPSGGPFEPPTMPPLFPGPPPPWQPPPGRPPARRPWILPVVAVCVVVLIAGSAGAYLLYGQVQRTFGTPLGGGTQAPPSPSKSVKAAAVTGPDVCTMLPKLEAERLVPEATVAKDSRDAEYTVNFSCNWTNRRISFGEFWRSREIDVKVAQHRGNGAKTGRTMAQNSYDIDYGGAKFGETAKPTAKKGEKDYVSAVKEVPGVGDAAYAQYTWRRSGTTLWYSFGTARARVQDMTIEVRYQASQQRKDAQVLSSETVQSVTEANAIREATKVITQIAKGVAAWKAEHPDVLAQPHKAATAKPSPAPTPSPTELAAFPPACQAVAGVATGLVPGPTTRTRRMEAGDDTQTECRWLNREIPVGQATRIRSVLITVHSFTNRAGVADATAAKSFYSSRRGSDRNIAQSSLGGLEFGKVFDLEGLGQQAYGKYVRTRRGEVSAGSGSVIVLQGAVVVEADYAGADRPKDEPANSPNAVLMAEKQARAGALTVARAFLPALADKPIGS